MKIKRLYINNYKSLVDFELAEPNPFSVFVGPNAAGKSNIFEALEFLSFWFSYSFTASELFGGEKNILNLNCKFNEGKDEYLQIEIGNEKIILGGEFDFRKIGKDINLFAHSPIYGNSDIFKNYNAAKEEWEKAEKDFSDNFSRFFVKNLDLVKIKTNGSEKLRIDAHNMEAVLHRILQDEMKREEIMEWVDMLIPGLEKIDVVQSELSGDYVLRIFEKHIDEPIRKNLISDGTYNILALLTAVYQSDEPQFLCIEEPENGLNPYVIRELVGFFRQVCEEKGHYIWLNTHSATLVKELKPEELILINKIKGVTTAKQLDKDLEFKSMPLDEAWLTNTLGGGVPW